MLLRRKIFTEKKVALVCAAVLVGLSIFPVLKYSGLLGGADGASSALHSTQQEVSQQVSTEEKAVKETPAEQTLVAEGAKTEETTQAETQVAEEVKTEEVAKPAAEPSKDTYSYTAEAGGSYTLAARQAVNNYIAEKKLSVDESQRLAAEVNLVNAAGAPYLEVGQVVNISRADVAKELPAAETAEVKNDAAGASDQNDASTQNDAIKDANEQTPATAADVVKTAAAGDSYTLLAREVIKTAAAGSLNDAQKIAAETYLANQAGFPKLEAGQNVTFSNSAIQEALKFARGLTAEQQAAWQAYVPSVVF